LRSPRRSTGSSTARRTPRTTGRRRRTAASRPTARSARSSARADTPFLRELNKGREAHGPTRTLTIRNADSDFVYISGQDGIFPGVPAEDRNGRAWDFSLSPTLEGAQNVALTGQGAHDIIGTGHLGILNSPETWRLAYDFVTAK
jgi:hypothetical protein